MTTLLSAVAVTVLSATYISGAETASFSCNVVSAKHERVFSARAMARFDVGDVKSRSVVISLSTSRADLPALQNYESKMSFGHFGDLVGSLKKENFRFDFVDFDNSEGSQPTRTPLVIRHMASNGKEAAIAAGMCEVNWKATEK